MFAVALTFAVFGCHWLCSVWSGISECIEMMSEVSDELLILSGHARFIAAVALPKYHSASAGLAAAA